MKKDEIVFNKNRIIVAVALAFLVCIFGPFELYISNINEFFFSIYELLPYCLVGFVLVSVVVFTLLFWVGKFNKKIEYVLYCSIFIFTVAIYIQGNYLPASYGSLDGTEIVWKDFVVERLTSLLLWIVALVVILILYNINKKTSVVSVLSIILVCAILTQLSTLVVLCISNDAFRKSYVNVATKKDLMKFSDAHNLIVFVVDSLDSRMFSEVINDNYERYSEMFEDFVYCKNTTGNYLYTELAVPNIITGELYDDDMTYKEYINEGYRKSEILNYAMNNDMNIGIYTNSQPPIGDNAIHIDNLAVEKISVSSHKRLMRYIYKLVGFKYLPFELKKTCWFYPDEIEDLRDISDSGYELYDWDNFSFYNDLDNIETVSNGGTLKFIHVKGAHAPFHITKDFDEIDGETTYYEDTQGVLVLIEKFITSLKNSGIYDNSAVVILADHGYLGYRQNPTLLIKGKNEHHLFEERNEKISYNDLQSIFIKLMDSVEGNEIVDMVSTEGDERVFYMHERDYSYSFNEQHFNVYDYIIDGDAGDDSKVISLDGVNHLEAK